MSGVVSTYFLVFAKLTCVSSNIDEYSQMNSMYFCWCYVEFTGQHQPPPYILLRFALRVQGLNLAFLSWGFDPQ